MPDWAEDSNDESRTGQVVAAELILKNIFDQSSASLFLLSQEIFTWQSPHGVFGLWQNPADDAQLLFIKDFKGIDPLHA